MKIIRITPMLISCLLLSAHFLRSNMMPLVIFSLSMPIFLFVKQQWATRLLQLCLVLGAVEWLRTASIFVSIRQDMGMPWIRLALILGGVSIFTALSALPLAKLDKKTD